jgi:hypothetical protein
MRAEVGTLMRENQRLAYTQTYIILTSVCHRLLHLATLEIAGRLRSSWRACGLVAWSLILEDRLWTWAPAHH